MGGNRSLANRVRHVLGVKAPRDRWSGLAALVGVIAVAGGIFAGTMRAGRAGEAGKEITAAVTRPAAAREQAFYYVGGAPQPGAYGIVERGLTLSRAAIAAGETDKGKYALVVRPNADGGITTYVRQLREILENPEDDVRIQDRDLILLSETPFVMPAALKPTTAPSDGKLAYFIGGHDDDLAARRIRGSCRRRFYARSPRHATTLPTRRGRLSS